MIIRGIFIPRLPTVTASTKLNYGTFGIAMFGYIALQRRVWASAYTVSIADLCACAITVDRSRYWREILRCGAKMFRTCSAIAIRYRRLREGHAAKRNEHKPIVVGRKFGFVCILRRTGSWWMYYFRFGRSVKSEPVCATVPDSGASWWERSWQS